jgi:hypothetical protein
MWGFQAKSGISNRAIIAVFWNFHHATIFFVPIVYFVQRPVFDYDARVGSKQGDIENFHACSQ